MMTTKQLNAICDIFGYKNSEKWKTIKYIFIENPIIDVQFLLNKGEITYIENSEIGAGFYIMGMPNADFGVNDNTKVVTFIPLSIIDKVQLITSKIPKGYGAYTDDVDFSSPSSTVKFIINNNKEIDNLIKTKTYVDYSFNDTECLKIIG